MKSLFRFSLASLALCVGCVWSVAFFPTEARAQVCPGCSVDLVTMVPGDGLFTGFGHIAFRVRNPLTGDDDVYDYGTYDAQDPLIGWHFLTGQLKYYCSHTTWTRMVEWYSEDFGGIEVRGLDLSAPQVDKLVERVTFDCMPENAAYAYHHFFNNCSTRIRDILDDVLGGELSQGFKGKPAKRSLRQLIDASMSRPAFAPTRWIVYGLLNGTIDQVADRWEQAFLPYYLTAELDQLKLGEAGKRPLVTSLSVATGKSQGEPPEPASWPGALTLGFLVLMGLVPWLMGRWKKSRAGRIWAGTWLAFVSFLGAFYGLVLTFSWVVSPYPETKWNWTVLCFHPLHLFLTVTGIGMAAGAVGMARWAKRYVWFWGCCSLVALLGSASGLIGQRVWHYGLAGLAVTVPLILGWWLEGRASGKPA